MNATPPDPLAFFEPPAVGDSGVLQAVELLDEAALGYELGQSGAFAASGGLMLLAFLAHIVIHQVRILRGQRADFVEPLLVLMAGAFLIGSYRIVYEWIVAVVSQYGTISTSQTSILSAQARGWAETAAGRLDASGMNLLNGSTVLLYLMDLVVWISFNFAAGVVFGLKLIQKVAFQFVLAMGPLMIALSCFPGPTRRFLSAWVMAIIELATWGVAASTFARFMDSSLIRDAARVASPVTMTVNLAETLVFNIMYAFAFLAIPVIVAMVLHGRGAASNITSVAALGGAALAAGAVPLAAGASSLRPSLPGAGRSSGLSHSASSGSPRGQAASDAARHAARHPPGPSARTDAANHDASRGGVTTHRDSDR